MGKKNQNGTAHVRVSVVIPVYNAEAVLTSLFDRLYPVLDGLGMGYEAIFVDDGSRDRSPTLLRQQHRLRPDVTRVLVLRGNAGQQAAVMAGFEVAKGDRVVTLDADLQVPPEEIPRVLAAMDQGHDYVSGIRLRRRDAKWREVASKTVHRVRTSIIGIEMMDQTCMLRAYDRDIVDAVLQSCEAHTFIPALASTYAADPTEIEVEHDARAVGEAKYPLFRLVRLNLDLMTGYSLLPLQVFSLVGFGIALISFLFVIYLGLRRLLFGAEVDGAFILFGILVFLAGLILLGLGLLGEYVGRIYEQSRGRPRYLVRRHLRPTSDPDPAPDSAEARR